MASAFIYFKGRSPVRIFRVRRDIWENQVAEWWYEYAGGKQWMRPNSATHSRRGFEQLIAMQRIVEISEIDAADSVTIPHVSIYHCEECGRRILIEPATFVPITPVLCQLCDPAFANLLDNKHHQH